MKDVKKTSVELDNRFKGWMGGEGMNNRETCRVHWI